MQNVPIGDVGKSLRIFQNSVKAKESMYRGQRWLGSLGLDFCDKWKSYLGSQRQLGCTKEERAKPSGSPS